MKRNALGQPVWLKKVLISLFGWATHPGFTWVHKATFRGTEHLEKLPRKGVMIVSNHQTYFAEVTLMYHVFSAVKWGFRNTITNPVYLFNPRGNLFYVAAEETMKAGLLPRLFQLAGALTVKRTWREAGQEIQRDVDPRDTEKVGLGLSDGWVITFPQGTTKPFEKGRKGTAHLVKTYKPIVVPVRVDGFRRGFDKKGMRVKKEQSPISLTIYPPLNIDFEAPVEVILNQIMVAIGQVEVTEET